ncbi:hypothetical protein D3C85_1722830 [compost metagenome]
MHQVRKLRRSLQALNLGRELLGFSAGGCFALALFCLRVLECVFYFGLGGHVIEDTPLHRSAYQGFGQIAADGAVQEHNIKASIAATHTDATL